MVTQSGSTNWVGREAGLLLVTLVFLIPFTSLARASNLDEAPLDAATLLQMEQRAETAQPRDQCYMFAEVLHGLTELAGRQMAAGDDEQAAATFTHIDSVAEKMEKASAANAKRLKNAEMILEHITRRLTDMAHIASSDQRNATQAALKNIDHLHTQVLAVLFSK
jgi:hypothetical protein